MIKLKDILKEWTDDSFNNQPKRWSKSMEDTKNVQKVFDHRAKMNSASTEGKWEEKFELYFRDDLKNKPISRGAYSEINGQMRHLEFGIKDLKKSIKKQNDNLTLDNIQYIILKAFQMKEILEKK